MWQRAFELAVVCHALADRLPRASQRALADQLRRAALSVPSNIAEGHGRRSRRDFLRFLRIAHGSLAELETHLRLAERRSYLRTSEVAGALEELGHTGRLLGGLMRRLEAGSWRHDGNGGAPGA